MLSAGLGWAQEGFLILLCTGTFSDTIDMALRLMVFMRADADDGIRHGFLALVLGSGPRVWQISLNGGGPEWSGMKRNASAHC
jgi:hypothetical protein